MSTQPSRAFRAHPAWVGLLAAMLALIGLHVVVGTAGAAEIPAGVAVAAEPQTWVVDAVDDAMGNRWVAQATGGSDLTIVAGDTVLWQAVVGTAGQGHDLTSTDDGTPWDPPVLQTLAPGGDHETYSYTFDEPGTYTYICATHETAPMIGSITVLPSAPPDNQAPTASPMVSLSSSSAPTTASFMAHASDPDGDALTYAWDFGDATDGSDQATVPEPTYLYRDPGTYTVALSVSDGTATSVSDLQVVVGDDDEPPPVDDDALAVTATATPESGTSRAVAFGGEVTGGRDYTTGGAFQPFADGLASYPDLRGTATLLRAPGSTRTSIDVTGLKPNAAHLVHVHERACSDGNGGAHFRFDTTLPFAEANEIWLPFTSDGAGRSGLQTELSTQRAGADAVSIVIHDPDNSARRIGCVDLVRDTSPLAATWDFGDGTTATGLDPVHVYRDDGRYTATLTVDDGQAEVSDDIDVVVDAAAPETTIVRGPRGAVRSLSATFGLASNEVDSTFACRVDGAGWHPCGPTIAVGRLREGAHVLRVRATDQTGRTDATPAVRRWTVDVTEPRVQITRPGAVTRDRTPTLVARVRERQTSVVRHDLELRVDGTRVAGVRYDARTGRVTWTPRGALSRTRHVVQLVAVDAAGNRASDSWTFRVR